MSKTLQNLLHRMEGAISKQGKASLIAFFVYVTELRSLADLIGREVSIAPSREFITSDQKEPQS